MQIHNSQNWHVVPETPGTVLFVAKSYKTIVFCFLNLLIHNSKFTIQNWHVVPNMSAL